MDVLSEHYKRAGLLHAYALEGAWEAAHAELSSFIEGTLGLSVHGNPDVQSRFYETFGIDESRSLEAAAHRVAFAERKCFLIGCQSMTHEAQNALLKLFEDAPRQTHFFLVVPSIAQLLPTLRSRLFLISMRQDKEGIDTTSAQMFLKAAPGKRIGMLTDIVEQKNKEGAIRLVNGLEYSLFILSDSSERTKAIKEICMVRKYILDRSPSLKLLLEYLAVTLPVI